MAIAEIVIGACGVAVGAISARTAYRSGRGDRRGIPTVVGVAPQPAASYSVTIGNGGKAHARHVWSWFVDDRDIEVSERVHFGLIASGDTKKRLMTVRADARGALRLMLEWRDLDGKRKHGPRKSSYTVPSLAVSGTLMDDAPFSLYSSLAFVGSWPEGNLGWGVSHAELVADWRERGAFPLVAGRVTESVEIYESGDLDEEALMQLARMAAANAPFRSSEQ